MFIGRYYVIWVFFFVKCFVDVINVNVRDFIENERIKISKCIYFLKVEISDICILKIFF